MFLSTSFFCTAQSGTTILDSVLSGGVYRKFLVYVPTIYNGIKPVPLLFNFHGYTSNAPQQQLYGNFMPIADTANFIIVHPEGTSIFGSQFWNTGILASPNDVMFTDDMINHLLVKYNIDFSRVYSCGMSNGGIMSYYLACSLPNRIAAIASVTGSMFNAWFGNCSPNRPFPVMEIHGTTDDVVPFEGEGDFTPIDSVIKKWVKHNNCNPAITNSVQNIFTTDNCYAVNYRYTGGTNGSSVELYKVIGGGHSWPGSFPIFPNTNLDFSASVVIWRFFRQYKLTQFVPAAGLHTNELQNAIRIMPNPSSDQILIDGIHGAQYKVYSMDGKEVISWIGEDQINISALSNGIYFLHIHKNEQMRVIKFVKN